MENSSSLSEGLCKDCGNKIGSFDIYCKKCISRKITDNDTISVKQSDLLFPKPKDVLKFTSYLGKVLLHSKHLNSLTSVKIPPDESYQKAYNSSGKGDALGAFIGLGWSKHLKGVITIKDDLFKGIVIHEDPFEDDVLINIVLNDMMHNLPKGNVIIEPINKGWIRENIVGVKVKGNKKKFMGINNIEDDDELLKSIFSLIKSTVFQYPDPSNSKYTKRDFVFTVDRENNQVASIISFGLSTNLKSINNSPIDYPYICINSISCAKKIVQHLIKY